MAEQLAPDDNPFVTLFCAHRDGAILTVGGVTTVEAARETAARIGWTVQTAWPSTDGQLVDVCPGHVDTSRPARAQVDAALARWKAFEGDETDADLFAAEVRALRAEIAVHDGYTCAEMEARCEVLEGQINDASMAVSRAGHAVDIRHLGRSVRAALAARTPQPAVEPRALSSSCAGCGHAYNWHATSGDCRRFRCECDAFRDAAPLPAVPDGEDETAFLRRRVAELQEGLDATADALARAHALNREQHRELVHWTMVPPVPFGEDVPALLDAAADACANLPESPGSRETGILLRRAAGWIRTSSTAEVRAAVAAALGRPTGGEPRG